MEINFLGYAKTNLLREVRGSQLDFLSRHFASKAPFAEHPVSHGALDQILCKTFDSGSLLFGKFNVRTAAYVAIKRGFGAFGNSISYVEDGKTYSFLVPDYSFDGKSLRSKSGAIIVPFSALVFDDQTGVVWIKPECFSLVRVVDLRKGNGYAHIDSESFPLEGKGFSGSPYSPPLDVRYIDYSFLSTAKFGSGVSPLDFDRLHVDSDGYHGSLVRFIEGDMDCMSWRSLKIGVPWKFVSEIWLHPDSLDVLVSEHTRLVSIASAVSAASLGEEVDVSAIKRKIDDLATMVALYQKSQFTSLLFDSSKP